MRAQRAGHCPTGSAPKTSWLASFEGQQEQVTLGVSWSISRTRGAPYLCESRVFLFNNLCM